MQLRNVDFNLLLPLKALLEERSVSRAAQRMHMSQPALSSALSRLRRHFNDELLERHGNSYELTPLAVHLLERSYTASRSLERVFTAQSEFDPSSSSREFTIFTSDYAMSLVGGSLATLLSQVAPNVRVRFHFQPPNLLTEAPESYREVDGLLMPHGILSEPKHQDLFSDRWVCVVDANDPTIGDTLSIAQLSDMSWIYSLSGPQEYTPAMKQMQILGIEPRIEMICPSFLAIPALIRGSNRIAFMQELSTRQFLADGLIRVLECPFDVGRLNEAFWWSAVHDRDPEHIWFRSMLSEAVTIAGLPDPL